MTRHQAQRDAHKNGAKAAKAWISTTTLDQQTALTNTKFAYGTTLSDLTDHTIPKSTDPDYSYGFYKQVKSHVYCKAWKTKCNGTKQ